MRFAQLTTSYILLAALAVLESSVRLGESRSQSFRSLPKPPVPSPEVDLEVQRYGGVKPENVRSYFEKGASAVAFAGGEFQSALLETGEERNIRIPLKPFVSFVVELPNPG